MQHFADMCPEIEDGVTQNIISEVVDEAKNEVVDENHEKSTKIEWINFKNGHEGEDSERDDLLMCSFQFMNSTVNLDKGVSYSDTDILLDTFSTMSVFNNKKMLLNVKRSKKTFRAYSKGGCQESTLEGGVLGIFKVWYNPKFMLNILSFKDARENFRITMDTSVENVIKVHLNCGNILKFEEVKYKK